MFLLSPHNKIVLSIIITNHNYDNYLKECLDSVVSQSLDDIVLEIIIIDDNSLYPHKCEQIIQQYRHDIVFRSVNFSNPLLSRKYGFDISRGDYIIFLDADDKLSQYYISSAVNNIGDADIVYSDVQYFGGDNKRTYIEENLNHLEIALYNYMHVGCLVSRKSILISNAFDHRYYNNDYHEDWYFWRRIISCGFKANKQPQLYHARVHDKNRSTSIKEQNYYEYRGTMLDTVALCGFPSIDHENYFAKYQSLPAKQSVQFILDAKEVPHTDYYHRIPFESQIQVLNMANSMNMADYIFYYDAGKRYQLDTIELLLKCMDHTVGIVHNKKYQFMGCTLVNQLLIRNKKYVSLDHFIKEERIKYVNV